MTNTSASHTLVFHGEIMPGHDPMHVRTALAQLLGLTAQHCEHVFSGQRVVLKRNLAPADTGRYVAHLEKIGVRVAVEPTAAGQPAPLPIVPAPQPVAAPEPPATTVVAPAPVEEVTCPKCGERQPKRTLCRSCATDMPRFFAARQQAETEARAVRQAAVAGARPATRGVENEPAEPGDGPAWVGISFAGRLGRLAYLWSCLLVTALAALGVLGALKLHSIPLGVAVGIAALAFCLRTTALRCHDIGWSGWLALITVIPYVGAMMSLLLLVIPGHGGASTYGPPTRRAGGGAAAVGLASLVLSIVLAKSIYGEVATLAAEFAGGESIGTVAEVATGNARFAADNQVTFYAAPNCPCAEVRDALENMGVNAQLRVIDQDLSAAEQDALHERIVKAGISTNPTRLPLVNVNGVLLEDPPPEAIIANLRIQR